MSSGRHCTSTCSDTSAGTSPCSMHQRAKSKSVCEADGKADLDLLEAHVEQQVEHARLALVAHRVDQRLVAVAQVDRAPDRRLVDAFGRPGAVGETDQRIGLVFAGGVGHAAGGADIASFVHRLVLRRTGGTGGPWRGNATIRSSCGDCDWPGASASNRPPGAPSAGPAIADKAEKQQRRGQRAQGLGGQGGRAVMS